MPKFALRERVNVPGTNGKVQGVITWRIDSVHQESTCGVVFLTVNGTLVTKPFTVGELASGTVAAAPTLNKARRQLRARRKR